MPHDFGKEYKKGFFGLVAFIILAVVVVLGYMYIPQHNDLRQQLVSAKGNKVYTVKRNLDNGASLNTGEKTIDNETGGSFRFVNLQARTKKANREIKSLQNRIGKQNAQIKRLQTKRRKLKKKSKAYKKKYAKYSNKINAIKHKLPTEKKHIKAIQNNIKREEKKLTKPLPKTVVYTNGHEFPASVGKKTLSITFGHIRITGGKIVPRTKESFKVTRDATNSIHMKRTSNNGNPRVPFEKHIHLIRVTHHNFL